MGGRSTLRTRIKALDAVFSQYIRRRHADSSGFVRCSTCGTRMDWKSAQCGHFWKRSAMSTRFDPRNCSAQCPRCNLYRGGAEAEHAAYILKEYGVEVFEELERRHTQVKKWRPEEIESLILYYKQKIKELDDTCQ